MTTFAETVVAYPDGQYNVSQPPNSTILNGFIPEQAATRGQPLPAQWLNWALRTIFRSINRDIVSDATGALLFPYINSAIRLEAIDMNDSNKYLVAIGYKGATGTHVLKVVSSATLTLGTATASGDQPISGGANIRAVGYNRQIGDL
jgi:hypothetical protein